MVLKQVMSHLSVTPKEPLLLSLQAQALDKLAERGRSNKLLEDAIAVYLSLLQLTDIDDELFIKSADRCINRMRFRGEIFFFDFLKIVLYIYWVIFEKFLFLNPHRTAWSSCWSQQNVNSSIP